MFSTRVKRLTYWARLRPICEQVHHILFLLHCHYSVFFNHVSFTYHSPANLHWSNGNQYVTSFKYSFIVHFSYCHMYNLSDYEISAESALSNHGGVENKDLVKVVNNGPIDDDDNELDTMSYSPYFLPSNVPSNMINTYSPFGILSLNTGSLSAKFSDLQVILETLSSQNNIFLWYVFRSLGSLTRRCYNYFI